MKATLEFTLPEEQSEFDCAINGTKYLCQWESVWEELFRPRHKHGYHNQKLQKLIDDNPAVSEAFDLLEDIYREIVAKYE